MKTLSKTDENKEGKEMSKLYDQGWKKGFGAGFRSGLAVSAGLAVVMVLKFGEQYLKAKGR